MAPKKTAPKKKVIEEEEEYEVEDILEVKKMDGQTKALVKWDGYDDPSDNTWEPLEHLEEIGAKLLTKLKNLVAELEEKGTTKSPAAKPKARTRKSAVAETTAEVSTAAEVVSTNAPAEETRKRGRSRSSRTAPGDVKHDVAKPDRAVRESNSPQERFVVCQFRQLEPEVCLKDTTTDERFWIPLKDAKSDYTLPLCDFLLERIKFTVGSSASTPKK